jgi:hypothetical protein
MPCEQQGNIDSAPKNCPMRKEVKNLIGRVPMQSTVQHHADSDRHQIV